MKAQLHIDSAKTVVEIDVPEPPPDVVRHENVYYRLAYVTNATEAQYFPATFHDAEQPQCEPPAHSQPNQCGR